MGRIYGAFSVVESRCGTKTYLERMKIALKEKKTRNPKRKWVVFLAVLMAVAALAVAGYFIARAAVSYTHLTLPTNREV